MSPVTGAGFKWMNDSCDHLALVLLRDGKDQGELESMPSKLSCVLIVQEEQKVQGFFPHENSVVFTTLTTVLISITAPGKPNVSAGCSH